MKKYHSLIILIGLCFLQSCSDFLNVEPVAQISINEQFSTKTNALKAVNGLYVSLETLVRGGKIYQYADLQGGNLTINPLETSKVLEFNTALGLKNVYDFNDVKESSNFKSFYEDAYAVINAANLILENIDKTPELTSAEKNQIKAESLSVRAYTHYVLSLLYAQNYAYTGNASHLGIIYVDKTLAIGKDFPSRKTMAETYSLLKNDLNTALSLFTDKQALSYGATKSYFNSVTTKAIYAVIALQMNDWANAEKYATEVLSNANGAVLLTQDNYISFWQSSNSSNPEAVLELSLPRDVLGVVGSSLSKESYAYFSATNYGRFVASQDLRTMYTSTDIRKNMFLEKYLPTLTNGIVVSTPYYFTEKFQQNKNTPIVRLSELYLINAEAKARLGKSTEALQNLNVSVKRAGLAEITTTTNLLEDIFAERRKELAFEGKLFFDILRYKKNVVRNQGCFSTACSVSYPSPKFILPIPLSSIDNNQNMIQNESY